MNINNINVNKYPVSQVFDPESKVIFEIPKYQREYTWGSREWEALFDDLVENDDGYFLGSINLTDIPPTRDLSRMFMAFIEEIEQNGYVRETIYSNLRYKLMDNSASDEIFEEKHETRETVRISELAEKNGYDNRLNTIKDIVELTGTPLLEAKEMTDEYYDNGTDRELKVKK